LSSGLQTLEWGYASGSPSNSGYIYLQAIKVDGVLLVNGDPGNNDSLVDTPTNGTQTDTGVGNEVVGNYAMMNPLDNSNGLSLSNGNLEAENTNASNKGSRLNFKFPSSGKWYIEASALTLGGNLCLGISPDNQSATVTTGGTRYILINSSGSHFERYNDASSITYSGFSNYTTGAILQIAFDADNDRLWFGLNNQWMDSGTTATGNPSNGSNPTLTSITNVFPSVSLYTSKVAINAGQRAFAFSAPTGFKSLNTANFPTPTIADGSKYFDTKLYTGNGSTQSVTGYNFSPDFVWLKSRNQSYNHYLFDQIRGAGKVLQSNNTDAEVNQSDTLTSFNSDGFSLDSRTGVNSNNNTFVGWAWDAGTSTVTNNDGSIASQVRANPSAGFSIVKWTGTGSSSTVGHGLSAAPAFIILKNLTGAQNWYVYSASLGAGKTLSLNITDQAYSDVGMWGGVEPTSSVFTANSYALNNRDYIAYCFAPVAGYSAMGSYTGNGNADGPFVYTGFKPAWILYKRSDASGNDWTILDSTRGPNNVIDEYLQASNSNAEAASTMFDFLSNGFKPRLTSAGHNASGGTYIYLAFASNPFASNGGLAR